MGKRIIEELATDTIQDNDFILMDNNTTPTDPDDDTAGTRKIRASEFGAQIIPVDDELSTSSENPVQNKVITGAINDLASATEITGTASGSIASFDDGSTLPLKTLQVSIEPVQSGSGESSPSNVRPISGWTSCNVTVDGANLLNAVSTTVGTREYTVDSNGYITYNGTTDGRSYLYANCQWFVHLKSGTYYVYGDSTSAPEDGSTFKVIGSDNTQIRTQSLGGVTTASTSFTITDEGDYGVLVKVLNASASSPHNFRFVISPQEITTYSPFNRHTYNIAFTDGTNPLTVYGGTLDVTSGLLTVDRVKISKKWSDFSKSTLTNYERGTISLTQRGLYPPTDSESQKCNIAPWLQNFSSDSLHFYCNATQGIVFLPIGTDGDTDIDLLYELETPQTYQLTPTAVASILGVNNVSVDTGNVLACEYIKDTDIVIKKLLYKDLTAILSANATSLTITDSAITTDATYDIFTDTYGVSPTAVSVSNGSMTLTFTARTSATKVKVRVML